MLMIVAVAILVFGVLVWWNRTPAPTSGKLSADMVGVEAAIRTNVLTNSQTFEACLEKNGVNMISEAELLERSVNAIRKDAPYCIGPKQEAFYKARIKELRAKEAEVKKAEADEKKPGDKPDSSAPAKPHVVESPKAEPVQDVPSPASVDPQPMAPATAGSDPYGSPTPAPPAP